MGIRARADRRDTRGRCRGRAASEVNGRVLNRADDFGVREGDDDDPNRCVGHVHDKSELPQVAGVANHLVDAKEMRFVGEWVTTVEVIRLVAEFARVLGDEASKCLGQSIRASEPEEVIGNSIIGSDEVCHQAPICPAS